MRIIEAYMHRNDLSTEEKAVVKRIVHTTGDPALIDLIKFSPRAIKAGLEALQRGCSIFTDVNMVRVGIDRRLLQKLGGEVNCHIASPEVAEKAGQLGITRAATALRLHAEELDGQLVAIGNAPTALFEIISLVERKKCSPALVIGVPVGFVGAAESKEALAQSGLEYITLPGTRGGSPVAVAAVNALLNLAANNSES